MQVFFTPLQCFNANNGGTCILSSRYCFLEWSICRIKTKRPIIQFTLVIAVWNASIFIFFAFYYIYFPNIVEWKKIRKAAYSLRKFGMVVLLRGVFFTCGVNKFEFVFSSVHIDLWGHYSLFIFVLIDFYCTKNSLFCLMFSTSIYSCHLKIETLKYFNFFPDNVSGQLAQYLGGRLSCAA